MKRFWALAVGVAALATPALAAGPEHRDSLGTVISDAIHEGGSFFTASERALVERKCGYRPGEWDGLSISINNGVLTCGNGRKVDDAETRAMLKVVTPRISARVARAMAKPEVQEAIRQFASESARKALENLANNYRD